MGELRLSKPWIDLTPATIEQLPAQLGVYEIGDADGRVLTIGYAGGREQFGMRSALGRELARPDATCFRHEFTHGYLSRFDELLMVHQNDWGALPPGNVDHPHRLGRLTVDGSR